jgi:hypothetical protein
MTAVGRAENWRTWEEDGCTGSFTKIDYGEKAHGLNGIFI